MKGKIKIIINLIFVMLIVFFMGYILRFFGVTNEQIGDLILISLGAFLGLFILAPFFPFDIFNIKLEVCKERSIKIIEDALQIKLKEIFKYFSLLTPEEKDILSMRFGLRGDTVHTIGEISQEFEITREKIREIEAKVLEKIKKHKTK